MYLHCRHGFVEADAWDGQPVPVKAHQVIMDALAKAFGVVIVARARRKDTLRALVDRLPRTHEAGVLPRIEVIRSPAGWDYEWRVYLTPVEWGMCMTSVAMDLDYRNFKHTAQDGKDINPREYALAYAIWTAAYQNVVRDTGKKSEPTHERFDLTLGTSDDEDEPETLDRFKADELSDEDLERDLWKGGALR
jgi:hypothetical protein